MVAEFDGGGIHFRYPENWRLEREDNENGWVVAVQSPETAFMLLSVNGDMPNVDDVAATALEALREEYPELEADESTDSLAGKPSVGHDIRFFSLDLTNTCWTRCFYSPQGTVLVLCQTTDQEAEKNEQVLRAMCASLSVDAGVRGV